MTLSNSMTGEGKLVYANSEVRTWIEHPAWDVWNEVKETVRTEEREWYALTESLIDAAMAIHTEVYDPLDCAVSKAVGLEGVYIFEKETGIETHLLAGEKVYWNPATDLITTIPGTLNLMGWVWEYAGSSDVEVKVAVARYSQNATLTEPAIGAYTLTRHIESKVREETDLY